MNRDQNLKEVSQLTSPRKSDISGDYQSANTVVKKNAVHVPKISLNLISNPLVSNSHAQSDLRNYQFYNANTYACIEQNKAQVAQPALNIVADHKIEAQINKNMLKPSSSNPLLFKYSSDKSTSKKSVNKPTGILKKTEGSSHRSSATSDPNIPNYSQDIKYQDINSRGDSKPKKGVQFNSKINVQDGIEKLKDEGQFKKAQYKRYNF